MSVLNDSRLWRARDLRDHVDEDNRTLSTGFPQLDRLLVDGGWPPAALIEVLCSQYGVGELRLLATALTRPVQNSSWTVLINPPCVPYAPAFQSLGIDVHDLVVVRPKNHQEALWAFEEAVDSGTCRVVLGWLHESELKDKQLRRIQSKSKSNGVLSVLFRPTLSERLPSPAELRLKIESQTLDRKLCISIIKRRGGWRVDDIELPLPWGPSISESMRTSQLFRQWEQSCRGMKAVQI